MVRLFSATSLSLLLRRTTLDDAAPARRIHPVAIVMQDDASSFQPGSPTCSSSNYASPSHPSMQSSKRDEPSRPSTGLSLFNSSAALPPDVPAQGTALSRREEWIAFPIFPLLPCSFHPLPRSNTTPTVFPPSRRRHTVHYVVVVVIAVLSFLRLVNFCPLHPLPDGSLPSSFETT